MILFALEYQNEAKDKNGTLKLDRLNACVHFSEPRIGTLKADRVNGPLVMDQCFA